jgi:hypothetical protein
MGDRFERLKCITTRRTQLPAFDDMKGKSDGVCMKRPANIRDHSLGTSPGKKGDGIGDGAEISQKLFA